MVFLKKTMNFHTKYALVSVFATALDFTIFFGISHFSTVAGSVATFTGACAGGVLSYFLHAKWVFSASKVEPRAMTVRYVAGVLLSIFLNSIFVGISCDWLDFPRIPSRILAAVLAWIVIFWFNRRVVFKV
jgi:putative flippase GtrA